MSKALYRRACAREGLYFSRINNKQIESDTSNEHGNTGIQTKDRMALLHDAIDDLKRALLYLEKELKNEEQQRQSSTESGNENEVKKNSNSGIKKQCKRSLNRLQKEYDRQEKRQRKNIEKVSHRKFQSQQKRDVMRLLIARHQNGKVLHGEAFFLLEWNWWTRWCRYVDFFGVATNGTKKGAEIHTNGTDPMSERTRRLLSFLPMGATPPSYFREDPDRSMDDDSSDSSDDDESSILAVPGCIDNTKLLVKPNDTFFRQWYLRSPAPENYVDGDGNDKQDIPTSQLKPNIIRGYHYEILPREVYNALRIWYGEKTPSICRRITSNGSLIIHPIASRKLMILCQKAQRCNACRAPGASFRCGKCLMVQYCDRACQESHWSFHRPYCKPIQTSEDFKLLPLPEISYPSEGGLLGLNNLGNTCFMNSALQSLSHATPLTRHFLSNRFRSDLNKSNPLGTGGKLALAYETFLKDIWMKQGMTSISPTSLKRAIALFAPRFANYQQHDAQEFLAYLLDGLHEDLNRIRQAPYVEMPDVTDGQNMTVAAAKAWNVQKRRNDSTVMDTFYGQFQSTCVCPICDRVSVSFDTFNHVSLEIPSNRPTWPTMAIPVLVHFADGNRRPVRYGVKVRRQGFVSDLKSSVANLSQIDANKLVLTDVYENSIYKLLDEKDRLSTINPNEDTIVAYEVTPYTVKDTVHIIVSQSLGGNDEEDENQKVGGDNGNTFGKNIVNADEPGKKSIGMPFMASIGARNSTCRDLWELMCGFVQRIVVEVPGDATIGEMPDDAMGIANAHRLDDMLTVHIVDAQGRPRSVFEKAGDNDQGNILPHESEELISTFLGDNSAENFLFLTLVWNYPSPDDKKSNIVINPNKFLDFDSHPTLADAMREQQSTNDSTPGQGMTLHHCFQSFSRPERLDTDNMWYCSKCKQHVQALKTMKLWRLPNILVIHLKRFEYKNALRRDKLGTFVDFPLVGLDMKPHCANVKSKNSSFVESSVPADYDLFSVVNHYGRLGFGHYTSFAMQWDETGISKIWNAFDDSSVHPISPSEIKSSAAYILFYRRRIFH